MFGLFKRKVDEPVRPAMASASAIPLGELPVGVLKVTDANLEAVGRILKSGLSSQSIDEFGRTHRSDAFEQIGKPYGAYDSGEVLENPVAQFWQHVSMPIASDAVVIRRNDNVSKGIFRVEAREGSNILVLFKGHSMGAAAAGLLCRTVPGRATAFVAQGDSSVFEGAVFKEPSACKSEFEHIRDHILRKCTACKPLIYKGAKATL